MRAIGYVRVSTADQANEGVSLDAQKSKIVAYCTLKDLNLSEIIEDAGISAKNLKRPGVQKVLTLARKKQVDTYLPSTAPWKKPSAWTDRLSDAKSIILTQI